MARLRQKPKRKLPELTVKSGRFVAYTRHGGRVLFYLSDGTKVKEDFVLGNPVWVGGKCGTLDSVPVVGETCLPEVIFEKGGPVPVQWGRLRPWKTFPVPEDLPF